MTVAILFGTLILCLIVQVPVGISLGVASLSAILSSDIVSLRYLAQSMSTSVDSFPLMAVPFFILAGELMGGGGISQRLLKVANAFFGRFTGGMAIVAVVACMFFAAISGSGPATVAAIGGLVVPEMLRQGYDKGFTCGLIAAAGSIGVIIPPSIPMIIYAVATNVSISTMFLAGFVPGILVGLALIGYSWLYAKRRNIRHESGKVALRECLAMCWEAKWALLVPVVILGGIYGGIFTPTEAAAIAVVYGFIVGKFVYGDLGWKDVMPILAKSGMLTATIMIILGTATTFGRILTLERVPDQLAQAITAYSDSATMVVVLVMLLLLFVGCIMETLAAIIILAPILLPVAMGVGIDPIHFGIIMVTNLAIGFITPPLGVNLFVTCGIADISMDEMSRAILPWLLVLMGAMLLIALMPQISLLLPALMS